MKEFIFDEYQQCINPNRLPFGNKEFYGEIQTACHKGKWHVGNMYWRRGKNWSNDPALNTRSFETERDAIVWEIEHVIRHLTWIQEKPWEEYVPDFVFKELKKLLENTKNPQLDLFSHS